MKQYVNFSMFCDSFSETYKNHFSYEGKKALFDYLEEYEESTGEEIELDPVALCCEYTEYGDFKEVKDNYSNIETIEELENHTIVIPIERIDGSKSESFIIQDF